MFLAVVKGKYMQVSSKIVLGLFEIIAVVRLSENRKNS